jgi:hypothetical protein
MREEEQVAIFSRLFQGRTDVYGNDTLRPERQNVMAYGDRVAEHLFGENPMGVYPMVYINNDWEVNWGCVDFDEGESESFIHALNLKTVLEAFGITGWCERSRSKGYHVWVFAKEAVPARKMRHALLAATTLAKAPTKEINPKSEWLEPDQIGNFVRLPYPNGWSNTHRRCVVNEEGYAISLEMFLEIAYPTRLDSSDLDPLLEFYKPPRQVRKVELSEFDPDTELPSTANMNAIAYKTWLEGPFEDADRSSTLYKMVREIRASGYSAEEARLFAYDADKRWGKFHQRGDVYHLDKLVQKVYGFEP